MTTGQLFMLWLGACAVFVFALWGLFEWACRGRNDGR